MAEREAEQQGTAKKNEELEGMVKLVLLEKATSGLGELIKETRKDYPFEEHWEGDNNLTGQQFVAMLTSKANDPANKGRPLPELTVEVVKELSAIQSGHKDSVPKMPDKVDEAWLKENHPDLHKKLVAEASDKGVADHLKDLEESPPSLKHRKAEVDTSPKDGEKTYDSTKDAIKAWRKEISQ